MSRTECAYKVGLDVLLTAILYSILNKHIGGRIGIIASVLIAHTLNFIFNGHIFVVLKNVDLIHTDEKTFYNYCEFLRDLGAEHESIEAVVALGSLSRDELHSTSDLDIRIIRSDGVLNGIFACWLTTLARSRALFDKFPLDIFVLENAEELSKIREDERENLIVLYDKTGLFD
ncbi:nucleotidyltransferase domain-containing protein [Haloparvum alkalitolerans]|uniref:nucleotidyltransferase domain-containing protein n=1 Tax=Haloparvum alkalitolerans TaxID=1042953 RepID=UPI003CF3FBC3